MEIEVSETPVLISNARVLELLQKRLADRNERDNGKKQSQRNKRLRHRDWIEENVAAYLKDTPCTRLDLTRHDELDRVLQQPRVAESQSSRKRKRTRAKQPENGDDTAAITTPPGLASHGFDLTEAESLQILNFMPTEPVEIHLMVEELHARMSETQQDEFLEFIEKYSVEEKNKSSDASERKGGGTTNGVAVKMEEGA